MLKTKLLILLNHTPIAEALIQLRIKIKVIAS